MHCHITPTASLAARAMVSGKKPPTLYLNSKVMYSHAEIQRLIQHEIGVHLATTFNGRMQPLRVFSIGLPGATESQEGLAIWRNTKRVICRMSDSKPWQRECWRSIPCLKSTISTKPSAT